MNKHTNSRSFFAAISTFLLIAMLTIGALCVRKAQADETTLTRHALPTSEPSLVKDPSTLTGENWMSGISGSLFLHEINVPGTHDSCMWDPYTDITAAKTQYGYARTQTKDMSIQAQLKAGVRLFDIRLTNVRNSSFIKVMFGPERLRTSGTQGLYPVHGAHKGWLGDWRFYGDQKKGVLTFDTLMGWYTEFLRKHPTETLILDINYESDSGDKNTTLSRAREKLNKFYNEKNPSTGKPYIYMENGNKVVASMPSLADCRGQIVVMSCDDLQVGMHYDWTRDWNPKTIGGIHFAVENHYEATKDDKVKYLDALIKGGSVGNQTFSDPVGGATQQIPRSADDTPLARSIVASTGSNRPLAVTSSPHQSPKEIADVVKPRMYGNVGTLTSVGTHYGWIMSDFVTNDTVKTFWKTNFPSDMVYATVTYTAPAEMGYEDQTFNVLSGSEITLPSNPFVRENETLAARARRLSSKKSRIVGWAIDDEEYRPGATITVFDNATITAILSDQESAHNLLSSQNSESIKAETLATGLPGSSKEEVIAETQHAIDETKLHASGEEQPSNAATHTVAFVDEDSAESEAIPESQMVEEGSVATRPADPKREHAEFVGWYTDLNVELSDEEISAIEEDADLSALVWVIGNKARVLYDFDDPVNADVMLYARWDRKECSVTYMDQGDELYTDIVYEGDNAEDLQFDEVDGYTFVGWYKDDGLTQPYDFSQPVTEDLTLYSAWTINRYTVTFQSNGGSEVAPQEVEYEGLADVPADPKREGYTFMGWYEDLGYKLTEEEIAHLEEAEGLYGIELTDPLWQTDKTTLAKYDLENEPVYYDLELQARWKENDSEKKTASTTGAKQSTTSTAQPSTSSAQAQRTSTPTTGDASPNVMLMVVAGAAAILVATKRFVVKK